MAESNLRSPERIQKLDTFQPTFPAKAADITSRWFLDNLTEDIGGQLNLRTFTTAIAATDIDSNIFGFNGTDWDPIGVIGDALKVTITDSEISIFLNGIYDISTNPIPDTVGLIGTLDGTEVAATERIRASALGELKTIEQNGIPEHFNGSVNFDTPVTITPSNTTREIWISIPKNTNSNNRYLEISFDSGVNWFGPFGRGEKAALKTEVVSFLIRGDDTDDSTIYSILTVGK